MAPAVWYRTDVRPEERGVIVAERNGAYVCEVAYSKLGAGVNIPGGLVHSTAPSANDHATREWLLDDMFAFAATAPASAPHVTEIEPLDEACVRELVEIMQNLIDNKKVGTFLYPHVHKEEGGDVGFKKKIKSGDDCFDRYAARMHKALAASPSLCGFTEAHVLMQSSASARFSAHVDKMQGDDDTHPVEHATVIYLGDEMKLALFFVGARSTRKRSRAERYLPP